MLERNSQARVPNRFAIPAGADTGDAGQTILPAYSGVADGRFHIRIETLLALLLESQSALYFPQST